MSGNGATPPLTAAAVRKLAQPHILALLRKWLPSGKLSGREYKARNPRRPDDENIGNFSINIDTGRWADFALPKGEAAGADIIDVAGYIFDITVEQAKARVLHDLNGSASSAKPGRKKAAPEVEGLASWSGPDPTLLKFAHSKLPPPVAVWFYRNLEGDITAAVVRYNMPDGSKEFRPWICVKAETHGFGGKQAAGVTWRPKAPPEPRPLYNLDHLSAHTTVVVTEGEKAADAATVMFGLGVTSMNGAKSPSKSDWSVMEGHDVIIWPDHDDAGREYANTVASLSMDAGAASVRIVEIPDSWPKGWDLADAPPEGADLQAMLADAGEWAAAGGTSHRKLAIGFADRHKDDLRFVSKWGMWITQGQQGWTEDDQQKVKDLASSFAGDVALNLPKAKAEATESASTIRAILFLAEAIPVLAASSDQWDANLRVLNTPDGIVNLVTGDMRERYTEDYVLKCTAVSPADQEDCPGWFAFLERITAGDKTLQAYLARIAGYALTGLTIEHALFFLYGTGRNGKGVFLRTLQGILSKYAANAGMEVFTARRNEQHSQELARLVGARLVTAQEVDEGQRWNESRIKTLTGGDPITARFMRENDFTYMPQFKLFIAGNYKPSLRSVDPAMRARLNLVPFTVTIPESERNLYLEEELKAEWPGILRWMLNGCLDWQKNGLRPPVAVTAATEEYFEAEDTFTQWLNEMCIVAGEKEFEKDKPLSADFFTPTRELFASWQAWAKDAGINYTTEKSFAGKLGAFRHGSQQRRNGFFGIRMRQTPGGPKFT